MSKYVDQWNLYIRDYMRNNVSIPRYCPLGGSPHLTTLCNGCCLCHLTVYWFWSGINEFSIIIIDYHWLFRMPILSKFRTILFQYHYMYFWYHYMYSHTMYMSFPALCMSFYVFKELLTHNYEIIFCLTYLCFFII